jgi:hypothetical protein
MGLRARTGEGNVRTAWEGLYARTSNLHISPIVNAGCKRDCRVRLHASPHPGISHGAEGTLRGSPAQMMIYLSGIFWLSPTSSRQLASRFFHRLGSLMNSYQRSTRISDPFRKPSSVRESICWQSCRRAISRRSYATMPSRLHARFQWVIPDSEIIGPILGGASQMIVLVL